MAAKSKGTSAQSQREKAGKQPVKPPRLRLPLATVKEVSRELARVYRSAKAGHLHVTDASRLANMLAIQGRLIEGSEVAARVEALENMNRSKA